MPRVKSIILDGLLYDLEEKTVLQGLEDASKDIESVIEDMINSCICGSMNAPNLMAVNEVLVDCIKILKNGKQDPTLQIRLKEHCKMAAAGDRSLDIVETAAEEINKLISEDLRSNGGK